jgi:hypothetical protein
VKHRIEGPRGERAPAARLARGLAALCVCALGCRAPRAAAQAAGDAPEGRTFRELVERDATPDVATREWTALVEQGRSVPHGEDVGRYPDGTTRFERAWRHGRPSGAWWSYWEDGSPRSHVVHAGPDTPASMRFWHANGALAAEGSGRDGVREGPWTFWHANGVVAARGAYLRALREGPWTFWDERGRLVASGGYEGNRRVGAWRHGPGDPAAAGASDRQ